ncbi:MAG: DUF4349 domain-containing protein [Actinomycetota bacterium]|nr:DUF4349 domain-containing protein [Actinomycetota bacterium]
MRRIILPTTALLVAAFALTGCAAAGGSSDSSDRAPAPMLDSDTSESSAEYSSGGDAMAIDAIDRQVITTGWVTITVDDPIEGAREAVRITESVGGRVDGRSEYAADSTSGGSATLTLRIPSSDLTAALDKLKALGEVEEVSLNANDVTMQSLDLDARITALEASITRLEALVPGAADLDDLITLETAISDRRAQLESLQSEQRYLADQVSMSTVTLNLVTEYVPVVEVQEGDPLTALQNGFAALASFFVGLITVLAFLTPGLIVLAILPAIVIAIIRVARRRKRAAAPAAEAPATKA